MVIWEILHWGGAVIGCIGAVFIAIRKPTLAMAIWLTSNTMLIIWAINSEDVPLAIMYVFLTGTSILGICRWWGWRREVNKCLDKKRP